MEKPKPKRVYWRLEFIDQPDIRWIRTLQEARRMRGAALDVGCEGPLRIYRITVYSARELREWERQREAEIRREERERVAAWLNQNGGYDGIASGGRVNTIEGYLTYLESQGHGVTARQIRALLEAERAKVAKLERDRDARIAMDRIIIRERDEARAERRVAHAGVEDVWFWEDSPADDPESLSCPVVMPAERLRRFVAAERERDEARSRVAELEALAEELMGERDKAERERNEGLAKLDTVGNVLGTVIVAGTLRPGETMRLEGDHAAIDAVRGLLARLARYEAPGPVLLTQEQIDAVANSDWEGSHLSLVHALLAAQHARDVAIVEAMNDESIAIAILTTINRESAGEAVRAAILRALKGEP